jgi:hypothetical protein
LSRLLLAAALVVAACGGAPRGAAPAEVVVIDRRPPIERQPVQVSVEAQREGGSLHLVLTGVGRGFGEREALEDPRTWRVTVTAGELELARLVNGPVRVSRQPVGRVEAQRWDIEVRFSVSFALPEEIDEVEIWVTPPREPEVKLSLTVPAADPLP